MFYSIDTSPCACPERTVCLYKQVPSLQHHDDIEGALYWRAPGAKAYDRVILPQPEIFLHPDSKYKGIKPDQMKVLADTLREQFAIEISDRYPIVTEPGPTTVVVRVALSGMYMKKSRFRIWNVTPVGMSGYLVKNAVGKNVSLVEATLEAEALDSLSSDRLGVFVHKKGQHKDKERDLKEEKSSWDEIYEGLVVAAKDFSLELDRWNQGSQ